MNPQPPTAYPFGQAIAADSTPRRRKIRKGTFSCWECKRRKIRCQLRPGDDVCDSCRRHGTECISQEFDEYPGDDLEEAEDRINHVEDLVERLMRERRILQPQSRRAMISQRGDDSSNDSSNGSHLSTGYGLQQQGSVSTALARRPSASVGSGSIINLPASVLATAGADLVSKCKALTTYLYSVFPHPGTAALIVTRGKIPFEVLRQHPTMSDLAKGKESKSPYAWTSQVVDTEKPVLLARRLTQLAICLQQLEMTPIEKSELQLNEPVGVAARRFVDIARQVTSQDVFIQSLAGLEALILEACFLSNSGNVRSAWLVNRRAISIAQVMGFPEAASQVGSRAEFIWFRLMFIDWHFCLIGGFPSCSADKTFAKPEHLAAALPNGRQERIHVAVAGTIIMRNVQLQQLQQRAGSHAAPLFTYEETGGIKDELQQARACMPESWWEPPTMQQMAVDGESKVQTARLLAQLHQFYLSVLVEQPYLIHYNKQTPPQGASTTIGAALSSLDFDSEQRAHCLLSTVDSAIEVLSRYLLFRFCNILKASYPGLDWKADTAAVALVLAHIEGHRLPVLNPLRHRRAFDLNMLEQTVRTMEGIESRRTDTVDAEIGSSHNPELLRRLLRVEAQAAKGTGYYVCSGNLLTDKDKDAAETDDFGVRLCLPYFGTVLVKKKAAPLPLMESPLQPPLGRLAKKVRIETVEPAEAGPSRQDNVFGHEETGRDSTSAEALKWEKTSLADTIPEEIYASPFWPATVEGGNAGSSPTFEDFEQAGHVNLDELESADYSNFDDAAQMFDAWINGKIRLEDIYSDIGATTDGNA